MSSEQLSKISNTIKFLSADMIQSANSGHPGTPMGLHVLPGHLREY